MGSVALQELYGQPTRAVAHNTGHQQALAHLSPKACPSPGSNRTLLPARSPPTAPLRRCASHGENIDGAAPQLGAKKPHGAAGGASGVPATGAPDLTNRRANAREVGSVVAADPVADKHHVPTASDMVAVAGCFRDLLCSPRQVLAAAAAIEGLPVDDSRTLQVRPRPETQPQDSTPSLSLTASALTAFWCCRVTFLATPLSWPRDVVRLQAGLEAWASASCSEAAAPSIDIEQALVRLHTWLRATVETWKRSGRIIPLADSQGQLTLQPGETRVLMVELVPAISAPSAGACATGGSERAGEHEGEMDAAAKGGSSHEGGASELSEVAGAHGPRVRRRTEPRLLGVGHKLEGALTIQILQYDEALRVEHEQRLQRFFQHPQAPQTMRELPLVRDTPMWTHMVASVCAILTSRRRTLVCAHMCVMVSVCGILTSRACALDAPPFSERIKNATSSIGPR